MTKDDFTGLEDNISRRFMCIDAVRINAGPSGLRVSLSYYGQTADCLVPWGDLAWKPYETLNAKVSVLAQQIQSDCVRARS